MKKIFTLVLIAATAMAMTACNECGKKKKTGGDKPDTPPPAQVSLENAEAPASLRIYIDNSGSMKGYTESSTKDNFTSAISKLEGIKGVKHETFFWGNKRPIDPNMLIGKALDLNPFSGAETPIPAILGLMSRESVDSNSLEFFVTDGIVSPKNGDAKYLKESLEQVKNAICDSVKQNPDIAVCIFRLTSGYVNKKANSYYYTYKNQKVKLPELAMRPFFVIAVGKRAKIQWLLDNFATDENLALYAKAEHISFGIHNHDTAVKLSNKSQFTTQKDGLKLTKKGGDFKLMANLPDCLVKDLGEEYINKNLEVLLNGQPDSNFRGSIKGNSLSITCSEIRNIRNQKNTITVRLKKKLPEEWMNNYNSDDDTNIKDDILQQTKTFALATLLQGIYEATDGGQMLIDTEIRFTK